jgi:hypothetical protein
MPRKLDQIMCVAISQDQTRLAMKFSTELSQRFRWINFPGAVLMVLLQRTPVVNVLSTAEEIVISSPVGVVLKSVVAAVAALGAVNTVVGATPLVPSSGTATGITVNMGSMVSVFYTVNGTQTPPASWTISGSIPPGLNFSGRTTPGTVNISSLNLAGTPTMAGTFNLTIQTFEFTNATGVGSPIYNYTITVNGNSNVAPSFTTQPAGQTVTAGSSVTFTAAASGTPAPTYQWRKGGNNIAGATNATFTINPVSAGEAGYYTVVASNTVGNVTSNTATLTVNAANSAPTFTTQPASQSVTVGGSVTFTAAASGTPAPTYQWKKGGTNVAGATNATFTINPVSAGDADSYTVVASNTAGNVTSNTATLTVNAANAAPSFTTQPASQTVTAGGSVTFTAAASGTPTPTYQWKKGGNNIAGATNSTFTINPVAAGDAGSYTVVASNVAGNVTSNAATLTVNAVNAPPSFTTQPASQTVTVGGSVTFMVAAAGSPTPGYQWQKDGVNIPGATNSSLTINPVSAGDAGSYKVVASNTEGNATSNAATLTVHGIAPAFTASPVTVAVAAGTQTVFGAAAGGNPTPTYQWQKSTNGGTTWTNLSNDGTYSGVTTGLLVVSNLIIGMDGTLFHCVATNTEGSATSYPATLMVFTIGATHTAGADFNGDGHTDILWRNMTTGMLSLWLLNPDLTVKLYLDMSVISLDWQVAGTGDFDGDGQTDILWRNTTSGLVSLWLMNGTTARSYIDIGIVSQDWQIAGTGDFDGDGHIDILWRNTASGLESVWLMNPDLSVKAYVDIGIVSQDWQIVGTGDFDGDDHTDILWQNIVDGTVGLWLMNPDLTVKEYLDIGVVSAEWQIAGAGDFDGDGHTDILWRNTASGLESLWLMNPDFSVKAYVDIGVVSQEWQIAR